MRTTITLDDDVASAVDLVRRDRHVGVSEAVNDLIRQGLSAPHSRHQFQQRTASMGLRIEVGNVADALEILDGLRSR